VNFSVDSDSSTIFEDILVDIREKNEKEKRNREEIGEK
jgi:hypothetical protein